MGFRDQLERKITGKLKRIKEGKETVQDSNVNSLITRLKEIDEASAEDFQGQYVDVVKEVNKNK